MRHHATKVFTWAVSALVLALLLPAAPAAEDKAKGPASAPPAAAAPSPAPAPEKEQAETSDEETGAEEPDRDDKFAVMDNIVVPAGEEIRGDVVCIGGNVTLLGKVRGDVVVIGGKLDMTGSSRGGVVGVGSKLILGPGASVGRDLVNVAGGLDRGDAHVGGQVINIGLDGWTAHFPGPFGMLGFILFWVKLLKLVLVFLGLLLLAALVPDRIRLMGEEAPLRPFMAFFAGLGGYVVLVMAMILLCITLIGIPAALLLYFAFIVVKWMGLAGIFLLVGRRIGRLLGRDLSLLGAILLGFLPFAILRFLPFCIGTFIWFVLEAMAVGLVILTRGGGRRYGAGVTAPAPTPQVPAAPPSLS